MRSTQLMRGVARMQKHVPHSDEQYLHRGAPWRTWFVVFA